MCIDNNQTLYLPYTLLTICIPPYSSSEGMFDYELVPVESFYTYFFVQAIAVTFGEVKFYVRAVSMNVVTD